MIKKAGDEHLWKTYYKVGDVLEAGNPEMSKAIPADEESLARWEKTDKPQLPCWLYQQCFEKRNEGGTSLP